MTDDKFPTIRIPNTIVVPDTLVRIAANMQQFTDPIGKFFDAHHDQMESIRATMAALDRQMEPFKAVMAAIDKQMEPFRASMAAIDKQMEPMRALAPILAKEQAYADMLEKCGWLPHYTTPWTILDQMRGDTGISPNQHLEKYYVDNWESIQHSIESRLASYALDGEAKAVFREALIAHGSGLYRIAPRLLFPEIERLSREIIHGGEIKQIASQHELKKKTGKLVVGDIQPGGMRAHRLFGVFFNHIYATAHTVEDVNSMAKTPVPNRHASLHGLVSYSTYLSSINMIFIADFAYQALSTIKRWDIEDRADS